MAWLNFLTNNNSNNSKYTLRWLMTIKIQEESGFK